MGVTVLVMKTVAVVVISTVTVVMSSLLDVEAGSMPVGIRYDDPVTQ